MFPGLADLPRRLLVDTGILLDVVLAQALPSEKRAILASERDVAIVVEYLQAVKPATTPQVIAEVDGHLRSRRKREQLSHARRASFQLLTAAVDEVPLLRLRDMDIEVVAAFGPTDAGLIGAASEHARVLFTSDGALDSFARSRGVSVL